MAHFAKIDESGMVTDILVIDQDSINTGLWGDPSQFVQTSYNNRIRKNFAGVGYTYDAERDAFIPPKPFDSWALDEETCQWSEPVETE